MALTNNRKVQSSDLILPSVSAIVLTVLIPILMFGAWFTLGTLRPCRQSRFDYFCGASTSDVMLRITIELTLLVISIVFLIYFIFRFIDIYKTLHKI
ncbi:MAG: hypothetical protein NVS1B7_0610 [Candidatus Saccharimonadales bacterium]